MKKQLLILAALTLSSGTQAEFYAWTDKDQERHVSNIPAAGFTEDGKLKNTYNPHAIDYQYRKMLQRLRKDSEAIEQEAMEESMSEIEWPVVTQKPAPKVAAPKEGMLNLRELIDLEKRSGRAE